MLPMIAEAQITLLACARAVRSSGLWRFCLSHSVAARIDDARPALIVSADAGARGGKIPPYKKLLDDAIAQAQHQPKHVLLVDRGLANGVGGWARSGFCHVAPAASRRERAGGVAGINETSCILYTSGTTGKPKASSATSAVMRWRWQPRWTPFWRQGGRRILCASDIGWVVGHSYIVYAPLLAGMATIAIYEGLPTYPDCRVWWKIVEKCQVNRMFSAPTAIRVLKKFPTAQIRNHDLSLEALYPGR